jgi:DNA-binding transcriptional MerR regulator
VARTERRSDSLPPPELDGVSGPVTLEPEELGCAEKKNVWLSTGDLARVCKTTVRTVRFYEESGLLAPLTRSEGGHRLFRGDAPARLQLVMDLREAGLSLQEVRDLFEMKAGAAGPKDAAEQMRSVLVGRIAAANEKIAVLRRLRDELSAMVGVLDECGRCATPDFPRACTGCDVMKSEDLPRPMRLLWRCPNG